QNVGQRNSEFVIDFLKRDRIKLLASDLNGSHSRRIRFNTGTGAVRVEKVAKADLSVAAQEQKYSRQLKEQPVTGDITFF
ncbi:MAG TPA: chemoreceptor glutamine deamidase CheD, partial [Limnobacter sp.]|nr:chemoreceptor glutamine deamidase CheD [Limnobacter sp.]